jgi:hypothetical protein
MVANIPSKHIVSLLSILLIASVLPSCQLGQCISGRGNAIRTTLDLPPFERLVLQSSLDIRLTRGNERHVEIEAAPNLVDLVSATVYNGTLTIRIEACFRAKGPFVVHITTPTLSGITIQGSGNVTSNGPVHSEVLDLTIQGSGDLELDVETERTSAIIQGSGDMVLRGTAGMLSARIQGSGDVRAADLQATDVKVDIMGSGDVMVNCNGVLDATIMGSGNIRHKGTPERIERTIKGSGTIQEIP